MGLAKYMAEVVRALATNPSWRQGQAYFNVLYEVRPDLSEQVRGTGLDPFYRAERIPAFLAFLVENWGE